MREFLGMRTRVVEDTWTEAINVPLYRFGAPPVRGAKVEYSDGESRARSSLWNLKVFGIGVAPSTSVEVSKASTYVASDGAWKEVYVPVLVRVSRVAVYDGDRLVGRGYEGQVIPPGDAGDPLLQKRGIRSVDGSAAAADGTLDYHSMVDVALAGDTSGAVHKEKRTWVTDVGRDLSVPLGKVIEVSALVRVKRTRRLELAFELPSGHDYRAYLCNGFTHWDSPRGPMPQSPRRSASGESAA